MRKSMVSGIVTIILMVSAAQADAARHRAVEFKGGAAHITGSVSGGGSVEYEFQSPGAQVVGIGLLTRHKMAYFDLLPADSEDAIFTGSVSGTRFLGELPKAGTYRVRVYLMQAAASRQESASYTLNISLRDSNKPPAAGASESPATVASSTPVAANERGAAVQIPFDQTLALQGISFHVQSPNAGGANKVQITPSNLSVDNSEVSRPVEGLVVGAEAADLNGDGSPEVYVFVRSSDAHAQGSLVAYSANRKRSLSEIYLPPVDATPDNAQGYLGHDELHTQGSVLVRKFPVYRTTDAPGSPSGGVRELQYKLQAGEAGWRLVLDRVIVH